jgi:hypothetical protein
MRPVVHPSASGVAAAIQRWCRIYTRGLPNDVAAARGDELTSDLHDEITHLIGRGVAERSIARSLASRAIRGAAADVAWRRLQLRALRAEQPGSSSAGWYPRVLLTASYALGSALLASAVYALARWERAVAIDWRYFETESILLLATGMAICLCGLIMLGRRRTRSIGALWVMASVFILIQQGSRLLAGVSTSVRFAVHALADWQALEVALSAGIMLFFLGVAIWWMPGRRANNDGLDVQ